MESSKDCIFASMMNATYINEREEQESINEWEEERQNMKTGLSVVLPSCRCDSLNINKHVEGGENKNNWWDREERVDLWGERDTERYSF